MTRKAKCSVSETRGSETRKAKDSVLAKKAAKHTGTGSVLATRHGQYLLAAMAVQTQGKGRRVFGHPGGLGVELSPQPDHDHGRRLGKCQRRFFSAWSITALSDALLSAWSVAALRSSAAYNALMPAWSVTALRSSVKTTSRRRQPQTRSVAIGNVSPRRSSPRRPAQTAPCATPAHTPDTVSLLGTPHLASANPLSSHPPSSHPLNSVLRLSTPFLCAEQFSSLPHAATQATVSSPLAPSHCVPPIFSALSSMRNQFPFLYLCHPALGRSKNPRTPKTSTEPHGWRSRLAVPGSGWPLLAQRDVVEELSCVVQDANMGHQLAGGNSS